MRIFKLSSIDAELRAKIVDAQKSLAEARMFNDKEAVKGLTDVIKKLMREEREGVSFLGKTNDKPLTNPGRSPAVSRWERISA